LASQQNKSLLNHFFIHKVIHSARHIVIARDARGTVFLGEIMRVAGSGCWRLWKTITFDWCS